DGGRCGRDGVFPPRHRGCRASQHEEAKNPGKERSQGHPGGGRRMRALPQPVPRHDGMGQGYRLISKPQMKKLVYRHNRITRSTHWVNALVLVILVMSGFQIFNAHPHLYWGSTSEPDRAFLSIAAANDDGEARGFFRIYGWQFDTTGVLGVQHTETGPAPRA